MADFDVVVVGAGPAGSAAAFHLASAGHNILLLDRKSFPRDKACGDALTKVSIDLIAEMGAADELARYDSIAGVEIVHGQQDRSVVSLDPTYSSRPVALVVPRVDLDALLVKRAVDAGARFCDGATATGATTGRTGLTDVQVSCGKLPSVISARFVIGADGATASFTRQIRPTSAESVAPHAFAVRAYYAGVRLDRHLYLHYPVSSGHPAALTTGYGWVFPVDTNVVNIGVGMYPEQLRGTQLRMRDVLSNFEDKLRGGDARFATMRQISAVLGAPLRFAADEPLRPVPGILTVGDAAGLVDPYTGEGIGAALASGKAAAVAISSALSQDVPLDVVPDRYAAELSRSVVNRTDRRPHARHVDTAWRIMATTLREAGPSFVSLRREMSEYAVGASDTADTGVEATLSTVGVIDRVRATRHRVMAELQTSAQLVARTLRHLGDSRAADLRAALLFLSAEPEGHDDRTVTLAACLETAHLATLLHQDILDERPAHSNGAAGAQSVDDANRFLIMAGDYLLGKSHALSAQVGAAESVTVSEAIRSVWDAAMQPQPTWSTRHWRQVYIDRLTKIVGPFYVLPGRLGAARAGHDRAVVAALDRFATDFAIGIHLELEAGEFRRVVELSTRHKSPHLTEGRALTYPVLHLMDALSRRGRLASPTRCVDLATVFADPAAVRAASLSIRSTQQSAARHIEAAGDSARTVTGSDLRSALSQMCAAATALAAPLARLGSP